MIGLYFHEGAWNMCSTSHSLFLNIIGLLGLWGEFHCYPTDCVSDSSKKLVLETYKEAFVTTKVQAREPYDGSKGLGYKDASFAYSTIGDIGWFFWSEIEEAGETDFWRTQASK